MIIDVSKYQGKIDWLRVKHNNAIEGVYIKATEGVGYIDPNFKMNVIGANSVNLPIGFYHFASLNSKDVITDSTAEAKAFYSATKGYATGLPYVLDIEKNALNLTPAEVLKWIQNFVLVLQELGIHEVVLYSYTPFLNTYLPKNHGLGDVMKLWIAQYTNSTPAPKLPNGWKNYWLWQYTSDGLVDGITGHVDLNKKPTT